MVCNGLQESIDNVVTWDDVDERNFSSFWEFVYTGSYTHVDKMKMTIWYRVGEFPAHL